MQDIIQDDKKDDLSVKFNDLGYKVGKASSNEFSLKT